jgi:hypothetical protein
MKKIPENQIENLERWIKFYNKNNKFPHKKIICTKCQNSYISLQGAGLSHLKKQFNNNIKSILSKAICKPCKEMINPKEEKEPKKQVEQKFLTREEMENKAEEIRKSIPKIDLSKPTEVFNLTKNKDVCMATTKDSCWRPDVYLDKGCLSCNIVKFCACPIKNIKRVPDNRRGKIKY